MGLGLFCPLITTKCSKLLKHIKCCLASSWLRASGLQPASLSQYITCNVSAVIRPFHGSLVIMSLMSADQGVAGGDNSNGD